MAPRLNAPLDASCVRGRARCIIFSIARCVPALGIRRYAYGMLGLGDDVDEHCWTSTTQGKMWFGMVRRPQPRLSAQRGPINGHKALWVRVH